MQTILVSPGISTITNHRKLQGIAKKRHTHRPNSRHSKDETKLQTKLSALQRRDKNTDQTHGIAKKKEITDKTHDIAKRRQNHRQKNSSHCKKEDKITDQTQGIAKERHYHRPNPRHCKGET